MIRKMILVISAMLLIAFSNAQADSLFDPHTFRATVADRKAVQVGDALTVLILENSSAQTSAGTSTEKSGGPSVKLKLPTQEKNMSVGLEEDFAGKGRIERSGKLLGTITVIVKSVQPNGDLNVEGNELIEVNDEKQSIHVEGSVRPIDILDNNTVVSSKIANARISYVGDGILASRQRPGFLSIVLSLLGLL